MWTPEHKRLYSEALKAHSAGMSWQRFWDANDTAILAAGGPGEFDPMMAQLRAVVQSGYSPECSPVIHAVPKPYTDDREAGSNLPCSSAVPSTLEGSRFSERTLTEGVPPIFGSCKGK